MKYPKYITKEQIQLLKYEVLSQDFYIRLTRELLEYCEEIEELIIARKNRFINLSRTIKGGKIYVLQSDDDGYYHIAEHNWHNGNFLLVFRDLNTIQFIEFMCELFKTDHFQVRSINELLEYENASFRFTENGNYGINVFPIDNLEDKIDEESHPNIRFLVKRMEKAFTDSDFPLVLLSSASIFETMAKDIIGLDKIQDETLGGFFKRFERDSSLPKEFLAYILETYNERSKEPLAGHGSTKLPTINKEQATSIKELTKAFVRIEYTLKAEKS
jgi:hypothetical protein